MDGNHSSAPVDYLLHLADNALVLGQRTESPMQIKIAGRRKLLARAKIDASRKIFEVTSPASKEESVGQYAR